MRPALICIAIIAFVVSGLNVLQIHRSNKRIAGKPVPLEPTPQNKGKRCQAKNYWTLNADDEPQRDKIDLEWYRQCYHLQERLINAASEGDLEEMQRALKDGANADGTFDNSYPALEVASSEGQTDAVILLLDNGADVNRESDFTITALGSAASYGHTDIVKILIENGADACYESDGGTAQKIALSRGFKETAKVLKESEPRGCAGHYSPWRKYRLGTI